MAQLLRDVRSMSATPRTTNGEISILRDLHSLADSWDRLAVGSGSPLHHYAWISACTEPATPQSELRVVVVGDLEQPQAIAPLLLRRRGVPRLEFPLPRGLPEPMDLIHKDADGAAKLTLGLARLGLPLFLERVPTESATLSALKQSWRGSGAIICRPALGRPSLVLDAKWAEAEPPLTSRRRSDLRRARRRAEALGPVSSDIVCPEPERLDQLLDEVFRVEAAGWKGRDGSALATDSAMGDHFRRYAAAASRAGVLRLCFLRIGDEIVAVQFAIESEDRFWLLKIGYDETFARCSPGMLLIAETVRYAAQRGLRSYEFLGSPEAWIEPWTESLLPCVSVRAYPARPVGLATLATDVAQAGWRRLGRSLSRAQ
jgi:CelD/BcsL family acetyltransferase involved in cellulose biosynthesis